MSGKEIEEIQLQMAALAERMTKINEQKKEAEIEREKVTKNASLQQLEEICLNVEKVLDDPFPELPEEWKDSRGLRKQYDILRCQRHPFNSEKMAQSYRELFYLFIEGRNNQFSKNIQSGKTNYNIQFYGDYTGDIKFIEYATNPTFRCILGVLQKMDERLSKLEEKLL